MKQFTLPAYPAMEDVWQILSREQRPLVVYGMGNGADKLLLQMEKRGLAVADFMASDGFVRGHSFHGRRVLSLKEVEEKHEDFVILLAFASSLPSVIEMLWNLAQRHTLLMPDLPVVGDTYFDAEFYNAHYLEFQRVYDSLADDTSKSIYAATLAYKLTGDIRILRSAATPRGAEMELLKPAQITEYVDCGAYRGDTLQELLEAGAPLKWAVCIEPDRRTYKKLCAYLDTLGREEFTSVNAAVWDADGMGEFRGSGNRNSSLVGASYENRREETPLTRVDTLCGDKAPQYIKYDVEGAEKQAIHGSSLTISRHKPKMLVSLYHRTEDLYELPLLLLDNFPYYQLYLRRPPCLPAWELNLVCIPHVL